MMSESHIPMDPASGETSAQPQCSMPQSDTTETCLLDPSESEEHPPSPQVSNGGDESALFSMSPFGARDDADESHTQQESDSSSSSSSSRSQPSEQHNPTQEDGIEKASTPSSSVSSIAKALSEAEDENVPNTEGDINENGNSVDNNNDDNVQLPSVSVPPPQPTPILGSSTSTSVLPSDSVDAPSLPQNNNISTNSNDDDATSDLDGEARPISPRNVSEAPCESEPNEVTVASQATSAAPLRTYPHTPWASISRTCGGLSNTAAVIFIDDLVKEDAITCGCPSSLMQKSGGDMDGGGGGGGAAYDLSVGVGSSPDAKPAAESIAARNRDPSRYEAAVLEEGHQTHLKVALVGGHHIVCDRDKPPLPSESSHVVSESEALSTLITSNIGVEPPAVVAPEDTVLSPLSPSTNATNMHTCVHNEKEEEEAGASGHHDCHASQLDVDELSAGSATALSKAAVEGAIVEECETVAEEDPSPARSTQSICDAPTQTSSGGVVVPSTCDADTPRRCPRAMLSPAAVGVVAGCELLESRLREEANVILWDNVLMYSYPTPLAMRQLANTSDNTASIPSDNAHVHDAATQYSPPPLSEARKNPHHDLAAIDGRDTRSPSGVVACLFSSDTVASVTCTSSCRESSCRTCSCDPAPSSQHGESPSETNCSVTGSHSVDGQMVHEEDPREDREGSEDAEGGDSSRHLFDGVSVSPTRASSGSAFGHMHGMGTYRQISHDRGFAAAYCDEESSSPGNDHDAWLCADKNADENSPTSYADCEGTRGKGASKEILELFDGPDEEREQSNGASAQRPSSPPAKRVRAVAFVCASRNSPTTAVAHHDESGEPFVLDKSPSFIIKQCDPDEYAHADDEDEPPYTQSPMTAEMDMDSIPHSSHSPHMTYTSHGGGTRAKSEAPASFLRRAKSVAYGLGGGDDTGSLDGSDGYAGPQLTPRTPTAPFCESASKATPPSSFSARQMPSGARPAEDIPTSASTGYAENKGGAGMKVSAQDFSTRVYQRLHVFLSTLKHFLCFAWTISRTLMPAQMFVLLVASVVLYSTVKVSHSAVMELWSPPEEMLLVRNNIPTVAELESRFGSGRAIYHPSILRKHYLTVLNKTYTDLDELTQVYAPDDDVGLLQVALAYHHARYRVKLYTRSLDESWLNRRVLYPLRDAYVFGLKRHGLRSAVGHALRGDLYSLVLQRGIDTFVCLAQSEARPCPSVAYAREGYEETFGQRLDWENVDAMRLFMEWVSHPERLSRDRIRLLLRHYAASEGHTVGL